MPGWVQALVAAAAALTAAGVVWARAVRPVITVAERASEILPVVTELTQSFESDPSAFSILRDIATQFTPNGGGSLRDAMDRLEVASKANTTAVADLTTALEAARLLASDDRRELARMAVLMGHIDQRTAATAKRVAEHREAMEGRQE